MTFKWSGKIGEKVGQIFSGETLEGDSSNGLLFFHPQETGQIFLLEELDCETTTSFSLTISANNSLSVCPLSSSVEVLIMVGDVNDNPPVLSQEVYNTTVPENVALSQKILQISATDVDKTVSQHVPYTDTSLIPIPTFYSLPIMSCSTDFSWGMAPTQTHSIWMMKEC